MVLSSAEQLAGLGESPDFPGRLCLAATRALRCHEGGSRQATVRVPSCLVGMRLPGCGNIGERAASSVVERCNCKRIINQLAGGRQQTDMPLSMAMEMQREKWSAESELEEGERPAAREGGG